MFDRQADVLRKEMLASDDPAAVFVTLKPASIASKRLKKLAPGVLIDGLDPLHLRIVCGNRIIARARLGQIGGIEAIHIVSTRPEPFPVNVSGKKYLLEARLRRLADTDFESGDILEYPDPLSRYLLLLADRHPVALGELVDYDGEPVVRVTEILDD